MKRILYIPVLALFLVNCTDERDNSAQGEEIIKTSIVINPPGHSPKGALSDDEFDPGDTYDRYVRTIDVLTFQNGKFFQRGISQSNHQSGTQTRFDLTLLNNGKPQDIVILANARQYIEDAFPGGLHKGFSKESILAALTAALPQPKEGEEYQGWITGDKSGAVTGYNPIPMWRELTDQTIKEGTITVSPVRMMAKIQVINTLQESKFKLSSIMLGNYRMQGRIVPSALNTITPIGPKAEVRSVNRTVVTGQETENRMIELYTFETDAPADQQDEENATHLIIGGKYDNAQTDSYYRLTLLDKDKKWQDLLRNHLYKVKIVSVSGPGSSTPDDISAQMKVSIQTWQPNEQKVIIESEQDYLHIDQATLAFYNNITSTQELKVTGSVQEDITITPVGSYPWLTITPPASGGDTWKIKADRIETELDTEDTMLDEEEARLTKIGYKLTPRSAELNVKLKNMTYTVKVSQGATMLNPPNSYFVTPGGTVDISLSKAFMIFENRYNREDIWENETEKISFSLVWEDVIGLIDQSSLKATNGDDNKRINAQLRVKANAGKEGNAVVAIHIGPLGNSSDPIAWSWHLWVTDYDPGDGTKATQVGETKLKVGSLWKLSDGIVLMDRNMGAKRVEISVDDQGNPKLDSDLVDSFGLHYHWGRKDPFPGAVNDVPTNSSGEPENCNIQDPNPIRDIYDSKGNVITETLRTGVQPNWVKLGIENPQQIIAKWLKGYDRSNGNSEIYTLTDWAKYYSFMWETPTGVKSVHDPCPKGWKIIKETKKGYSAIELTLKAGEMICDSTYWDTRFYPTYIRYYTAGNYTTAGFFPYCGFRPFSESNKNKVISVRGSNHRGEGGGASWICMGVPETIEYAKDLDFGGSTVQTPVNLMMASVRCVKE